MQPHPNSQMFTYQLWASRRQRGWKGPLSRALRLGLYALMTIQFVACYLFLSFPYIDVNRYTHGYERLPFQTRLLLAPLFRWAEHSTFMVRYASHLAMNGYFFPHGITPAEVLEFYLDIPCLFIAGWVAARLYQAASRRQLLGWLVYPLFLVLCAASYILHTVQNFRFIYDMPSMAFFALGLYLIYFRKSRLLLVALFAVATLNRETTLFLVPFYFLSEIARSRVTNPRRREEALHPPVQPAGISVLLREIPPAQIRRWKRILRPTVLITAFLMLAYWAVWHVMIFHTFRHNASEYYPRLAFNVYCFRRLRYYPQLFSAFGYLLPFVVVFRKYIQDTQLRLWLWMIPVWYAMMMFWGILVETRVFGELLPLMACVGTLIAEEAVVAAVQRNRYPLIQDDDEQVPLVRVA